MFLSPHEKGLFGARNKSTGNLVESEPHASTLTEVSRLAEMSPSQSSPLPARSVNKQHHQEIDTDLLEVRCAMDLFLDSRIGDAEALLLPKRNTSMYFALGHAFVLFLKALMSFQRPDIEAALDALQNTQKISNNLRKRDLSWIRSISYYAKGYSLEDVKSMTKVQQHAELVYAETNMLKALLGAVLEESLISFVQHGLTVRACYQTYRLLDRYVTLVKNEAMGGGHGLDSHFTSGVAFGIGVFKIMLSLLPPSVLAVAELIGFSGDRAHGMKVLQSIGGWEKYKDRSPEVIPELQGPNEGLRRQFADLTLLLYQVILSKLIPVTEADESLAERILAYNLTLYPTSVFFRYFYGRQLSSYSKIDEAKKQYSQAIDTQKGWRQLRHICSWELGLIGIMQGRWEDSSTIFNMLYDESTWSRAAYTYLEGVSLFMQASTPGADRTSLLKKAVEKMKSVAPSRRKIAGKSIPIEKFLTRKARQFLSQDNYLLLPDLEALDGFGFLEFMPRDILLSNLARVQKEMDRLDGQQEKHKNYYDDLCLANYIAAIIARLLLPSATNTAEETEMRALQKKSLEFVFELASKIQLDHYLYYYARYESARVMILEHRFEEAKQQVQEILRARDKGYYVVGGKKKYSRENALLFKCHNCLVEINVKTKVDDSTDDYDDESL